MRRNIGYPKSLDVILPLKGQSRSNKSALHSFLQNHSPPLIRSRVNYLILFLSHFMNAAQPLHSCGRRNAKRMFGRGWLVTARQWNTEVSTRQP